NYLEKRRLWGHRRDLGGNAYPLARFRGIIDSLSILSPEANVWERNKLGSFESLAADTFSMICDLYRTLHFVEFSSLKSLRSSQVPPSVLTLEEQEIYDFLVSWADEEANFRSVNKLSSETCEAQSVSKFLSEHIDDLCRKLQKIKEELPDS
ncbi:hypothetical protein AB4455_26320, partial [Vibrio sp. 10N.261.46.E12]|uniref:hypothetical protein n=2 Tax=unclassified Vibrio TaxID=2614977 RepID=UPI000C83491E